MPAAAGAVIVAVPELEPDINKVLPAASAICSLLVHASVALTQFNVLSVAPLRVMPPPSAVVSDGEDTEPNSIFLSSTEIVVLLTVVVVPLTVKFPVTTKLLLTVVLPVPAPKAIVVAAPNALTVVAVVLIKLKVVTPVVISPPTTKPFLTTKFLSLATVHSPQLAYIIFMQGEESELFYIVCYWYLLVLLIF